MTPATEINGHVVRTMDVPPYGMRLWCADCEAEAYVTDHVFRRRRCPAHPAPSWWTRFRDACERLGHRLGDVE